MLIKILVDHPYRLLNRGNSAIRLALNMARKLGKRKLVMPDQGGWLTYRQFAEKLKFEIIEIKTDYGIINPKELESIADKDSALILTSFAAYYAEQPMEDIKNVCKQNGCLMIEDATAAIGWKKTYGDIIIASFGEDKLINLGYGGMIACEDKEWFNLVEREFWDKYRFDESRTEPLNGKISNLNKRIKFLTGINKKVKQELKKYEIIHREREGINVIVRFHDEDEKNELIEYCKNNNYEYVICPKDIKVLCDAVSIEIKRLN